MINPDALNGRWQEVKQKLYERWAQLTNEELQSFDGNVEQLMDLIERKTGDAREIIEQYLTELTANAAAVLDRSAQEVIDYAQQSRERVEASTRQAVDLVIENCKKVDSYARQRPVETMLVCFGAGVLTGLTLGWLIRRR